MKKAAKYLLCAGILAAMAIPAFAETRTMSWSAVTTYTDGTPIEAGKTVTYTAYWTTDPGLGSLRTIGASLATTSTTFDPGVQGMTRGGTVYFTTNALLNTGDVSALSPGYAWVVPPVTPTPATLSSIAVSGPSSVNEGGTGTYTATATWSDGTTTSVTPAWSENSTYATISTGGVLTASAVTSNQAVTVTASYTSGGVTNTATRSVTIVDVPATLSGIAVSGPSSVNEGGTGTYTATATWSDGTTTSVTPTWSENSTYATIGTGGVLTASAVTSDQAVTVTATYGGTTGTKSVTIVNLLAGLSSVTVIGPSSVNESGAATYTATGTWDNGATTSVTPTWSVSGSYATISTGGVLKAATVATNQAVSVTASYGGKAGMKSVTIVDVPGTPPAAPKNVGVSGPISSGATGIWRIAWDQVTSYANDAPIEAGRTVRYTPYWTDDPALSAGSLRQLASSISGTTMEFDPSAQQMAKNHEVYFTVRAILDTGDSSSLAESVNWRVLNSGPVPPGLGRILKK